MSNARKMEDIEWCDIWIPSANRHDKPHILLIGDSITKAYYEPVCSLLVATADCARFTTSACVADTAFHKQLDSVTSQHSFEIIHFNNGLHGFDYTQEAYQNGYENALQILRTQMPLSSVVLALTTPLLATSENIFLNSIIDARNRIARELAAKYRFPVNDLHSLSKGHPECYADAYHYKADAIQAQAKHVAQVIQKLLNRKLAVP